MTDNAESYDDPWEESDVSFLSRIRPAQGATLLGRFADATYDGQPLTDGQLGRLLSLIWDAARLALWRAQDAARAEELREQVLEAAERLLGDSPAAACLHDVEHLLDRPMSEVLSESSGLPLDVIRVVLTEAVGRPCRDLTRWARSG